MDEKSIKQTKFISWEKLFQDAKKLVNERDISPFIHGGVVASGIVTESGNVYFGINIDSACGWGVCAERNAIFNMLTNGEHKVKKVLAVDKNGLLMPCGICREVLMQLDAKSGDIEILKSLNPIETITLRELLGNTWWADDWYKIK